MWLTIVSACQNKERRMLFFIYLALIFSVGIAATWMRNEA
jgi:hypothetical protein